MKLEDSIIDLPKVGKAKEKVLNELGIFSIRDLLMYFPRDCEDRSSILMINELEDGKVSTFKAKIVSKPQNIRIKRMNITKVLAEDDTGEIELTWFNQPYIKNIIKFGQEYIITGKVKRIYGKVQCSPKVYEIAGRELVQTGKIVSKYSLKNGITQKTMLEIMKIALSKMSSELKEDYLDKSILDKYDLCSFEYAITNIHFPSTPEAYQLAKKRLVFEEFFFLQLSLLMIKNKTMSEKKGISFKNLDLKELYEILPYELTNAQTHVINEILGDMSKNTFMNRLVQGDVGSGKTVCALAAMYIAAKNKFQAALMAPTEILAIQHYEFFKEYCDKLNITVELLVGSTKQKSVVIKKLLNGEIDLIIGTHAIIQENVGFKNLGLVITDEQHRFGVKQRLDLSNKGITPDVLVMTATPIPRTLGLILYGDLDISVIDELPAGRQKIDTLIVNTSYYERMYNFIEKEIEKGRQAYIICPMVLDSENESMAELNSVVSYTKMIKDKYIKNSKVEYVHGKMKPKEKNEIMERFMKGNIDILVSTTVIEVGINNPNATIMVIENAERFGLSQLHQLRGRVGRGKHKSYCILVSNSRGSIAKKRLETLKSTTDGFVISEKDLELRGPGDFFGVKQHGLPEFKLANLYEDITILSQAQEAAKLILEDDPFLQRESNKKIKCITESTLKYEVL